MTYRASWVSQFGIREYLGMLQAAGLPSSMKVDPSVDPGDILDYVDEQIRFVVLREATEDEVRRTREVTQTENLPWQSYIVAPLGIDHLAMSEAAVNQVIDSMEAACQN